MADTVDRLFPGGVGPPAPHHEPHRLIVDSLNFSNASHTFSLPLRSLFKANELPRGRCVADLFHVLQAHELGVVVRAQQLWSVRHCVACKVCEHVAHHA